MRSTANEPLLLHDTMRITPGHLDAFAFRPTDVGDIPRSVVPRHVGFLRG